jgi:hypothetical protein
VEWGLPDRHEERSLTPLIYEYQVINLVYIVLLDLADDFRSSLKDCCTSQLNQKSELMERD